MKTDKSNEKGLKNDSNRYDRDFVCSEDSEPPAETKEERETDCSDEVSFEQRLRCVQSIVSGEYFFLGAASLEERSENDQEYDPIEKVHQSKWSKYANVEWNLIWTTTTNKQTN